MKVMLDEGAFLPSRANAADAGLDLYARECRVVPAGGSAVFDTGVHMEIPTGFCGLLVGKSGLNVRWGLTSTGLIDAGYTGSIKVKLYNRNVGDYQVRRGDKISQIVILPVAMVELELVEALGETERGEKGFGSSGR